MKSLSDADKKRIEKRIRAVHKALQMEIFPSDSNLYEVELFEQLGEEYANRIVRHNPVLEYEDDVKCIVPDILIEELLVIEVKMGSKANLNSHDKRQIENYCNFLQLPGAFILFPRNETLPTVCWFHIGDDRKAHKDEESWQATSEGLGGDGNRSSDKLEAYGFDSRPLPSMPTQRRSSVKQEDDSLGMGTAVGIGVGVAAVAAGLIAAFSFSGAQRRNN